MFDYLVTLLRWVLSYSLICSAAWLVLVLFGALNRTWDKRVLREPPRTVTPADWRWP